VPRFGVGEVAVRVHLGAHPAHHVARVQTLVGGGHRLRQQAELVLHQSVDQRGPVGEVLVDAGRRDPDRPGDAPDGQAVLAAEFGQQPAGAFQDLHPQPVALAPAVAHPLLGDGFVVRHFVILPQHRPSGREPVQRGPQQLLTVRR
jgi:hypothetical protein